MKDTVVSLLTREAKMVFGKKAKDEAKPREPSEKNESLLILFPGHCFPY